MAAQFLPKWLKINPRSPQVGSPGHQNVTHLPSVGALEWRSSTEGENDTKKHTSDTRSYTIIIQSWEMEKKMLHRSVEQKYIESPLVMTPELSKDKTHMIHKWPKNIIKWWCSLAPMPAPERGASGDLLAERGPAGLEFVWKLNVFILEAQRLPPVGLDFVYKLNVFYPAGGADSMFWYCRLGICLKRKFSIMHVKRIRYVCPAG